MTQSKQAIQLQLVLQCKGEEKEKGGGLWEGKPDFMEACGSYETSVTKDIWSSETAIKGKKAKVETINKAPKNIKINNKQYFSQIRNKKSCEMMGAPKQLTMSGIIYREKR